MDLLSLIPDNISEVLAKIIRFTELRRGILYRNIQSADTPSYSPQDLPVLEFAEVLNGALGEHLQNRRLLFRDTPNIKFGENSEMAVRPVVDESAKALRHANRDDYLELQIGKLIENSLNRNVAEELLRQNCGATTSLPILNLDEAITGDEVSDNSSSRREATN